MQLRIIDFEDMKTLTLIGTREAMLTVADLGFLEGLTLGTLREKKGSYLVNKCKKLKSLKQCLTATRPTSHN